MLHMGELFSAQQALEGTSLAPGSEDTLQALRDPAKRPQEHRTPLPRHFAHPELGTQSGTVLHEISVRRDAEPLGVLLE